MIGGSGFVAHYFGLPAEHIPAEFGMTAGQLSVRLHRILSTLGVGQLDDEDEDLRFVWQISSRRQEPPERGTRVRSLRRYCRRPRAAANEVPRPDPPHCGFASTPGPAR